MTRVICIAAILLLIGNGAFSQENECFRKTYFGAAEICLPEIEGYNECYDYPVVKQMADGTEAPTNIVLGFYLNDEIYGKKDSLGLIGFDDYFKIYGTKQIKDYKADNAMLKQMKDVLAGNFVSKNWDLMQKEIDKVGLDMEIGVPTVIKAYNHNDESFTYVMLTKYKMDGYEPYTMAMSINGLLLNERLVWMAYYLLYEDENTILRIQKSTNKIIDQLLRAESGA
ncbi:MAG: hypothetical protein MI866_05340 [Bacteroidales bacterium]|nr:hypothetical protein [Bacteroidales bacterium]